MSVFSTRLLAATVLFWPVFAGSTPAVAAESHPPRAASHAARRPAAAAGPKRIGTWEDWQAATNQEGGQPVCYAFSRPTGSSPALPGRGDVALTVTERSGGRDAVALTAGFAYPAGAEMEMSAEGVTLPFYTSGRSAFARDGRAAVALFNRGRQAVAKSPGPRGQVVSDTFSLRGFSQAYAAIVKACPAK